MDAIMDSCKKFQSPKEEIIYWRNLAEKYKQEYEENKEEFEEYQISSRELEHELETQLTQMEIQIRDYTSANGKLMSENASLREKLEELQAESHRHMSEVQGELAETKAYKDQLQKYIRSLEQANDDLERSKRSTVASLEDFECRIHGALERNAILESELDEKEFLTETVQRLKDEARDLRHELDVREKCDMERSTDSGSEDVKISRSPTPPVAVVESNKLSASSANTTNFKTPTNVRPVGKVTPRPSTTTLTPSARITALNIVGDLLTKVAALESRLDSFKTMVKVPAKNTVGSTTPRSSRGNRKSLPQNGALKIPV